MSTNDSFANAITLSGLTGSVNGNASTDTLEAGEPAEYITASVWYRCSPPDKYAKVVVTDPTEETYHAVYTGAAVNALTRQVAGEYTGPGQYTAVYLSEAGTTYHVQVGLEPWNDPPNPTSTGFTLAWETCDRYPAPAAENRYLVLEDALTGAGVLTSSPPTAKWPVWSAWTDVPNVTRTAEGLSFGAARDCNIPVVQEALASVAFDIQVFAKFSRAAGTSLYGQVKLRFRNGEVSLGLFDYGAGPVYVLSIYRAGGLSTNYTVPLGFTPSPTEFVELRLRVGRGKVEAVRGNTTFVSESWDGLSGLVETPARADRVVLSGVNLNVFKDLTVIASTVDLPPVEPPAPPDGPFWGGFINTTETLQVL